jgi:hypothetical protein
LYTSTNGTGAHKEKLQNTTLNNYLKSKYQIVDSMITLEVNIYIILRKKK